MSPIGTESSSHPMAIKVNGQLNWLMSLIKQLFIQDTMERRNQISLTELYSLFGAQESTYVHYGWFSTTFMLTSIKCNIEGSEHCTTLIK